MSQPSERADVAVIGGGPGGYVAALCAAQRGARVILVEKERVGGTCLNIGCIPTKALETGAEVKVSQFPFSANPRAHILREMDGMVRLVCEAGSGRVLGVHLLGPRASDLVAEGALAVQLGATADDLAWTTHAHPTLPEAMLEAALGFRGAAIHGQSR